MVLGAIAVFIIDKQDCATRQSWAFAGAVLAFIGLIHGPQLGWGVSPLVALGYVMFAVTCIVLMRTQPAGQAAVIRSDAAPLGATPASD